MVESGTPIKTATIPSVTRYLPVRDSRSRYGQWTTDQLGLQDFCKLKGREQTRMVMRFTETESSHYYAAGGKGHGLSPRDARATRPLVMFKVDGT